MAGGPFEEAEQRGRARRRLEEFARRSISPAVPLSFPLPAAALLLLLLAGPLRPGPALAGCTEPPAPDVDWRRCLLDESQFAGADLAGAVLRDASLGRTNLQGARLRGADAQDARFISTDLTGADLSGANLRNADLTRATLRGADLSGADLRRARLFRADLREANLTGAQLLGTDVAGAAFDGARWTDGRRICAAGSIGACK
jgi:hypothetical protein